MKNRANAPRRWGTRRRRAKIATKRCALISCRLWPLLCSGLTRLRRAAFRFDPQSLELQTGALAISAASRLGVASITPGQTEPLLGRLGALWPAPAWAVAVAFGLVGLTQIVASLFARARLRCVCAMCGFCLWAWVFALAVVGTVPGLGAALCPVIALSQGWVYLRLSVSSPVPLSDAFFSWPDEMLAATSPADTKS